MAPLLVRTPVAAVKASTAVWHKSRRVNQPAVAPLLRPRQSRHLRCSASASSSDDKSAETTSAEDRIAAALKYKQEKQQGTQADASEDSSSPEARLAAAMKYKQEKKQSTPSAGAKQQSTQADASEDSSSPEARLAAAMKYKQEKKQSTPSAGAKQQSAQADASEDSSSPEARLAAAMKYKQEKKQTTKEETNDSNSAEGRIEAAMKYKQEKQQSTPSESNNSNSPAAEIASAVAAQEQAQVDTPASRVAAALNMQRTRRAPIEDNAPRKSLEATRTYQSEQQSNSNQDLTDQFIQVQKTKEETEKERQDELDAWSRGQEAERGFTAMLADSEQQRQAAEVAREETGEPQPSTMSMEMQEITKKRKQEVVIESADGAYKPKVSTWGMFPRPKNISKAYGGGRTIRPGEALESDEEKAAALARIKEAVARFEKKNGLTIDPELEAECRTLMESGRQMMASGNLGAAMKIFERVMGKVNPKLAIGGDAAIQYAICLDSMGRNAEAEKKYRSLVNHPNATVRKQANRMISSFKDMEFLKSKDMDYFVQGQGAYSEFFKSFQMGWGSTYRESTAEPLVDDSEDEVSFVGMKMMRKQRDNIILVIILLSLVGLPIALLAVLARLS